MKHGYTLIKNFLEDHTLEKLESTLTHFHKEWCQKNKDFYQSHAVNSAYITHHKTMSPKDRLFLFQLLSSQKIQTELDKIFQKKDACFLNTQLFFNPLNKAQKNYWHRDIQYSDLPIKAQKYAIEKHPNNVVHFRIALKDEPGIELIPDTHKRWDTDLEYDIRHKQNGKDVFNPLPNGRSIPLSKGDLLIFSANMIHRGLYGKDRLAFDIIYCAPDPDILKYVDTDCCPNESELLQLENRALFKHFT